MKKIIIYTFIIIQFFAVSAQIRAQEQNEPVIVDPFEQLKKPEIFGDVRSLRQEIARNFNGKEKQAIESALNILHSSRIQAEDGKNIDRYKDFLVAKNIFQQFPNESWQLLKKEYESGNAVTRGNIIDAIGQMDWSNDIKELLVDALDDQTICELPNLEMPEATPLRICDKAYNQLVLKYEIPDVLRTISIMHRLEVRDEHIQILKKKI